MEFLANYNDNDKELIKLLLGSNDDNFITFYHLFVHNYDLNPSEKRPTVDDQKRFIYSEPCDEECINENFVKMILFIACYHAYINYHCRKTPAFNNNFKKQLNKWLSRAKETISCTVVVLFGLHINLHRINQHRDRFNVLMDEDDEFVQDYNRFNEAYEGSDTDGASNYDIIIAIINALYNTPPVTDNMIVNYKKFMRELLIHLPEDTAKINLVLNLLVSAADATVATAAVAVADIAVRQNLNHLTETTLRGKGALLKDNIIGTWWDSKRQAINPSLIGYMYLSMYCYVLNDQLQNLMVNENCLIPHDIEYTLDQYKKMLNNNVVYNDGVPLPWNDIKNNVRLAPVHVDYNFITNTNIRGNINIYFIELNNVTYCKLREIEDVDDIIVYVSIYHEQHNKPQEAYNLNSTIFIEKLHKTVAEIEWTCVPLNGKDYPVIDKINSTIDGIKYFTAEPQPIKSVNIVLGHLYNTVMFTLCGANIDSNTVTDKISLGNDLTDHITHNSSVTQWESIYRFIEGSGKSPTEVKVTIYNGNHDAPTTRVVDITPRYTSKLIQLPVFNIKQQNNQLFAIEAQKIGRMYIYDSKEQIKRALTQYDEPKTLSSYVNEHVGNAPLEIGNLLYEQFSDTTWYVSDAIVFKYDKMRANIKQRSHADINADQRFIKQGKIVEESMCDVAQWNQITNSSCNYWNKWLASIVSCTRSEFTALRKKYAGDDTINILTVFKDVPQNYVMEIHPHIALSILKFFNFKNVQEDHMFLEKKKYKRLQTMEEWCGKTDNEEHKKHGLYEFLEQIKKSGETAKDVDKFILENKNTIVFLACLRRLAYENSYIEISVDKHAVKNSVVPVGLLNYYTNDKNKLHWYNYIPSPRQRIYHFGGALRKLLHSYDTSLTPITIGVSKQNGGSVHFPNGITTFLSSNDNIETYRGVLVSAPQKGGGNTLLPVRYNVDDNAINSSYMLKHMWNSYKKILEENGVKISNSEKFDAKLVQYEELHKDVNNTLKSLNKLVKYINTYPKQYDNAVINMDVIEKLINHLNLYTGRLSSIERHTIESILNSLNQFTKMPLVINNGTSRQLPPTTYEHIVFPGAPKPSQQQQEVKLVASN